METGYLRFALGLRSMELSTPPPPIWRVGMKQAPCPLPCSEAHDGLSANSTRDSRAGCALTADAVAASTEGASDTGCEGLSGRPATLVGGRL